MFNSLARLQACTEQLNNLEFAYLSQWLWTVVCLSPSALLICFLLAPSLLTWFLLPISVPSLRVLCLSSRQGEGGPASHIALSSELSPVATECSGFSFQPSCFKGTIQHTLLASLGKSSNNPKAWLFLGK